MSRAIDKKGVSETSIPLLPWMLGCRLQENTHICNSEKYHTFSDFKDSKIVSTRLNKFCLITSNKTFTRGHRNRVCFAERILKEYPNLVDVYGNGYNPISDKLDILSQYKYSIVIENCSYPNYWTEKLADCFIADVIRSIMGAQIYMIIFLNLLLMLLTY